MKPRKDSHKRIEIYTFSDKNGVQNLYVYCKDDENKGEFVLVGDILDLEQKYGESDRKSPNFLELATQAAIRNSKDYKDLINGEIVIYPLSKGTPI